MLSLSAAKYIHDCSPILHSKFPTSFELFSLSDNEKLYPVVVSIDPGSTVGIAAMCGDIVIWQEQLYLEAEKKRGNVTTSISRRLTTRRTYRRSRRARKTRHRKPRFNNRKAGRNVCKICGNNVRTSKVLCKPCLEKVEGKHQKYRNVERQYFHLPPSIKARWDVVLRIIKRLPFDIDLIIVENVYFDFQAIENPNITGREYQYGKLAYYRNLKSACKTRDNWKCTVCGSSENLHVHHIKSRSKGGTDRLKNVLTVCRDCHYKHHNGQPIKKLNRSAKSNDFFKEATHTQQGKNYFIYQLRQIAAVKTIYGYLTNMYREKLNLEKTHINDAIAMAGYKIRCKPKQFNGYINTFHVRKQNRQLHVANIGKGETQRKSFNRCYAINKRLNKKVYLHDIVRTPMGLGFISGFTGSSCYVKDSTGKQLCRINKKGNKTNTFSISQLERICKNKSLVSFLVPSSLRFHIQNEIRF